MKHLLAIRKYLDFCCFWKWIVAKAQMDAQPSVAHGERRMRQFRKKEFKLFESHIFGEEKMENVSRYHFTESRS